MNSLASDRLSFSFPLNIHKVAVRPLTDTADTADTIRPSLQVGVVFAVEMALRTVSLVRILVGSKKVLTACDRFHVLWVDAVLDAAQMVNIQAIWDLSTSQFVSQAVGRNLPFWPKRAGEAQNAVASLGDISGPQETWAKRRASLRQWPRLGLPSKSLGEWSWVNPFLPVLQMRCHSDTSRLYAWAIV